MINYALSCLQTNMFQSHTSIIGHYRLKDFFSSPQKWISLPGNADVPRQTMAGEGEVGVGGGTAKQMSWEIPSERARRREMVIGRAGFGAWAGSGSGSGTGLNLSKVLQQSGQISAWVVWGYWELSLKSGPLCCPVPGCPSVIFKNSADVCGDGKMRVFRATAGVCAGVRGSFYKQPQRGFFVHLNDLLIMKMLAAQIWNRKRLTAKMREAA